ncbi:phage tail protein [Deinococcus ruber]|uniref:Tail Collar domain-containing protein n=1 Tax=Deinococcus ruber TaxID=1848197 RepID=A0A918FGQ2_9DEIO|nr:tail fiber protein [Deinococcus ruber]GGR36671.1 tail Collar domain-containing protein [Deinococcus ruber]
MAQPYVGEIRIFAGNFAPVGWLFCQGQSVAISDYDVLFNLIGTTYGGDGQETFNLPNLQSRVPMHYGNGFQVAQMGGEEQVTLSTQQMPVHTHSLMATTNAGSSASPAGSVLAQTSGGINLYYEGQATDAMHSEAIFPAGTSQPHTNLQPYLCLNFIISMYGIYPSPS